MEKNPCGLVRSVPMAFPFVLETAKTTASSIGRAFESYITYPWTVEDLPSVSTSVPERHNVLVEFFSMLVQMVQSPKVRAAAR